MYSEITASALSSLANEAKLKGSKTLRLAILGSRSTNFFSKFIATSFAILGQEIELYEASYDQVEMELLNPASSLYNFQPDVVLIIHSYAKEYNSFCFGDDRLHFYKKFLDRTTQLVKAIDAKLPTTLLFMDNFEDVFDLSYGSASNETQMSFSNQLRRVNVGLMDVVEAHSNVHVFDKCAVLSSIGLENARDNGLLVNVDIPYKIDIEAKLGWGIAQQIAAHFGSVRKCLILDLDNTMWGGVIGDDGVEGIQLGNSGVGKAFRLMQLWAKDLKQRGILLAICSKNTEEVVLNALENHSQMVLRKDDFALIKANWNNKADNIQEIKNILNIGYDSMVFIDDNPFERELVRNVHPEVCVPEIPKDPADYVDFLRGLNLFELPVIENSIDRTAFFQEDSKRTESETAFVDLKSFLKSLELKAKLQPFDTSNAARVSELSLRSNQFNLRTIRYTPSDIQLLMNDENYSTYSVDLEDKFGSYGIISIVVLKRESEECVFIENWLMSCRAMQREVELFVLNALVQDCKEKGITSIIGQFEPTEKNGIVKGFYEDLGFVATSDGKWELDVAGYVEKGTSVNL